MMEKLDEADWGNNLDDAEGSDWAYFLGGPDDEAFEQRETTSAQRAFDDTPYDEVDESDQFVIRRPKKDALALSVTAAFIYALETKDYVLLRRMLESGFPPDARRHQGRTALMRAAYTDDVDLAELLFEYGANILAEDEDGNTPLSEALTKNGRAESLFVRKAAELKISARKEADSDASASNRNEFEFVLDDKRTIHFPTLQLLIKHNLVELLAEALSVGFDAFGEFCPGDQGQHPIYLSIEGLGSYDESDPDERDFGLIRDELFEAVVGAKYPTAGEILIENRMFRLTKSDERLQQLTPEQRDLLLQKNINDKERLEWVRQCKQKADLSEKPIERGATEDIFSWVEADNLVKVADYLFQHPGFSAYMPNGEQTFEYAYKRKLTITPILVAHGLEAFLGLVRNNFDQPVFDSRTALSLAAEFGLTGICRALIRLGANPNAAIYQNSSVESPLALATQFGHAETSKLLLEMGASRDPIQTNMDAIFECKTHPECSLPLTDLDDDIPF